MGLRYSFRHLFFGNRFHKERMWNTLEDLDARITALEEGNSAPTETPTEDSNGGDEPNSGE